MQAVIKVYPYKYKGPWLCVCVGGGGGGDFLAKGIFFFLST